MELAGRVAASSITFRDEPLEGALKHLRGIGFDQLDLTVMRHYCDHFDPLLVSVGEEAIMPVRDAITGYGMRTVSLTTYPANPLAKDLNGDDWVDAVDAFVRLGQYLSAGYMILPPGSPAPPPDRWRGTVEHAKPWLRDAADRALHARMLPALALQSNSILRTSQQGIDFLRLLNVLNVGLAVDPAHLAAMGEDPVEAIRRMGNAVMFVVLRDTDGTNFNLSPGDGTLDYPAILAALDEIEYDGPLVLAIDDVSRSIEDRSNALKRGWDYLERMAQRKAA